MEKRVENRKPLHERVELEIISESGPGEAKLSIADCKTVDISGGGVRLLLAQSIPIGTIMNMYVTVDGGERRFHLTAEVRWVRPSAEPGLLLAGFEIYDTEFSDSAAWRYFVQKNTVKK